MTRIMLCCRRAYDTPKIPTSTMFRCIYIENVEVYIALLLCAPTEFTIVQRTAHENYCNAVSTVKPLFSGAETKQFYLFVCFQAKIVGDTSEQAAVV